MVCRRRVRAIHRHDVHARKHLIEAFPIGGVKFLLDLGRDPAAVVIVDLQAECARSTSDGLPDAPHADNPKALAPNAMTEHPGRRPAGPVLVSGQDVRTFDQPARHRQDQRHGHVGGVLGQHARRIGDGNAALNRARDVYIVDAVAKIRDELELLARFAEHRGVYPVGDGGHENVGDFHRLGQLTLRHRLVVGVEPGIEKFPHPQLDGIGQLTRHNDHRLLALRHLPSTAATGGDTARKRRFSSH